MYFFAYFVCLGLVHFFVIPYSAYRSLAREREDETWVLLALTGLGPRRILRGKVTSFLAQAALYASAVGPFLLFSYYLNGIDLPTILDGAGAGGRVARVPHGAGGVRGDAGGRAAGAGLRALPGAGHAGRGVVQGLVAAFALSEGGARMMRERDFLFVVGISLWLMLSYGWLLFEAAAARLSLITEDYSRGPRRALVVQMLISAVVGGVCVWWEQGASGRCRRWRASLGCLHLTLAGLFVISDVDGQARALRAKTRGWSPAAAGRGARASGWWCCCWRGLGFCACSGGDRTDVQDSWRSMLYVTVAAAAYPMLYFAVALLVAKMPRSDRLASPAAVRILFVALAGLASVLPPLMALLMDGRGQWAHQPAQPRRGAGELRDA